MVALFDEMADTKVFAKAEKAFAYAGAPLPLSYKTQEVWPFHSKPSCGICGRFADSLEVEYRIADQAWKAVWTCGYCGKSYEKKVPHSKVEEAHLDLTWLQVPSLRTITMRTLRPAYWPEEVAFWGLPFCATHGGPVSQLVWLRAFTEPASIDILMACCGHTECVNLPLEGLHEIDLDDWLMTKEGDG